MSKLKAIICTILLFIVIFALLFVTNFICGAHGENLFRFITAWITGMYLGDKCSDFYEWLLRK